MNTRGRRIRQPTQTEDDYRGQYPKNKTAGSARRYTDTTTTTEETAIIPYQPGQVFTGANGVQYVVIAGKRPGIPPRASSTKQTTTEPAATPTKEKAKGKGIALLFSGVAATLIVIWLVFHLIAWWTGVQQDWTYTKDFRTYSIDQAVGQGGDSPDHPSHFIIQNDKGKILVIELPADNPQKSVMIVGATLLGADHEPVTVTFQDTTGSGRLDLILHFQGQQVVLINNGEKFIPQSS